MVQFFSTVAAVQLQTRFVHPHIPLSGEQIPAAVSLKQPSIQKEQSRVPIIKSLFSRLGFNTFAIALLSL